MAHLIFEKLMRASSPHVRVRNVHESHNTRGVILVNDHGCLNGSSIRDQLRVERALANVVYLLLQPSVVDCFLSLFTPSLGESVKSCSRYALSIEGEPNLCDLRCRDDDIVLLIDLLPLAHDVSLELPREMLLHYLLLTAVQGRRSHIYRGGRGWDPSDLLLRFFKLKDVFFIDKKSFLSSGLLIYEGFFNKLVGQLVVSRFEVFFRRDLLCRDGLPQGSLRRLRSGCRAWRWLVERILPSYLVLIGGRKLLRTLKLVRAWNRGSSIGRLGYS